MRVLKPPRLRPGDTVGLVAPAGPVADRTRIERGVRYLEGLRYRVVLGRHLEERHGFFAAADAERLDDLNVMIRNPQVRAIIAVRGGYGTPRLLPAVDYAALRRQPKILLGFSDITGLLLAVHRRTGLVVFSGPMAAVEFAAPIDPFAEAHLWRVLTSPKRVGELPRPDGKPLTPVRPGRAEGSLVAANLALLLSSLGTPYLPDLRGALLAVEDIGEYLHRVDRMFTQLRNAGVLRRLAGLILGEFTQCGPTNPGDPHHTLHEIFDTAAAWVDGPVARGLPFGHVARKLTLPLGCRARLDARRGSLEVLEGAVS